MRVDLFDFDLPEERIALRPAAPRDAARLLVVRRRRAAARRPFRARPAGPAARRRRAGLQRHQGDPGAPARRARRAANRGPRRGDCCIKRVGAERWRAFARPAKRLAVGDRIRFGETAESAACARRARRRRSRRRARAARSSSPSTFAGAVLDEAIERCRRDAAAALHRRPTRAGRRATAPTTRRVYAARRGRGRGADRRACISRRRCCAALDERGIGRVFVTLHVGAGTFLPVKAEDTAEHRMHAECGDGVAATAAALNAARASGRAHRRGRHDGAAAARERRRARTARSRRSRGETDIFITPGYRFRAVDVLMTNFHLPRSTLFMLVCGFCRARRHAARLCPRHRRAATASTPMAMPACCFRDRSRTTLMTRPPFGFQAARATGRRSARARRDPHAARRRSARRPSCRSAPPAR